MKELISPSTFERIHSFYFKEGKDAQLSPQDEIIRQRWVTAMTQLHDLNRKEHDVVQLLMKTYGICESQAYRDIRNARNLFGEVRGYTKDAFRFHVTAWACELYAMAKTKKDFRGMEKALERITKAMNLDKEDQNLPDPSKFQPPVQLLSINYNFINTPYFKMIDQKAQEKLLLLHERILAMAEELAVTDYFNMLISENPATEETEDES